MVITRLQIWFVAFVALGILGVACADIALVTPTAGQAASEGSAPTATSDDEPIVTTIAASPTVEPTVTPAPTVEPTAIPAPTSAPTATLAPTAEPTATPAPPSGSIDLVWNGTTAPVVISVEALVRGDVSTVRWDFGNGETAEGVKANYTYTSAGKYLISATVFGAGGSVTLEATSVINVEPGPATVIVIDSNPLTIAAGDTAKLLAVVFDDFGNEIPASIAWNIKAGAGEILDGTTYVAPSGAGSFLDALEASLLDFKYQLSARGSVQVLPSELSQITIVPESVTMEIGATQQYQITTTDRFGNEIRDISVAVNADSEVGSFSPSGHFVAGNVAGDFNAALTVTATQGDIFVAGTAMVSILADPLSNLKIGPLPAFVDPGEQLELTAAASDRFGNPLSDVNYSWSAEDGLEIDLNGMVTASAQSGRFTVNVTAESEGSTANASVTVGVTPTWLGVGDLDFPTRQVSAVKMQTGDVLVWSKDFVQVFDASEMKFQPAIANLLFQRGGPTMTLLTDGSILIVGGCQGGIAEVLDPRDMTVKRTSTLLSVPRRNATATLLDTGEVLIFGGVECGTQLSLASAEIFNPDTMEFRTIADAVIARSLHRATRLENGQILMIGGNSTPPPGAVCTRTAELFNPDDESWGRRFLAAQDGWCLNENLSSAPLMADGRVLVTWGANQLEFFEPGDDGGTFTVGPEWIRRSSHTVTTLNEKLVLIAGGEMFGNAETSQVYSAATGQVGNESELVTPRLQHAAVLLDNGLVLVVGGLIVKADGQVEYLNSAEVYSHGNG